MIYKWTGWILLIVDRSRKDSAIHTNEDLFNYFLLSSDPVISHISFNENISIKKNGYWSPKYAKSTPRTL